MHEVSKVYRYTIVHLFTLGIDQCIQHMHDAMLPELICIIIYYCTILVITLDPCIMQEVKQCEEQGKEIEQYEEQAEEVEQYEKQAEEVEQYEEQADRYPTHTSGQEQHDMEPEGPGDDTNSELSQDLRSSDSGIVSVISMHAW